MAVYKGYILTREYRESGGQHHLHYAGISDDGPFEIVITNNRPLFFIHRSTLLPKGFVRCKRRSVHLFAFDGSPVDTLYFNTQNELYKARRHLQDCGIKTFEADIRPEERYLMERFIYGGIEFQGTGRWVAGRLQFENPRMLKGEYRPFFSVLSLDIETGQSGELYSIACHFKGRPSRSHHPGNGADLDVGVVLVLDDSIPGRNDAPGNDDEHRVVPEAGGGPAPILPGHAFEILPEDGILHRMACEKDLLRAFLDVVGILDPDIIIGWHVVGFDLLFLSQKYKAHNLRFSMGRRDRLPSIQEIRNGVFRANISGRVVIDGPPALRAAFYTFDNYRLETVAMALLGEGKDIDESADKVAEIERRFQEDKKSLAFYNLMDCKLVSGIFSKTGLIDLTFKRAALSGLPMDRVGMSVAAFDFFMLPHIHRKKLVAPNIQDVQETGTAPGGWVFAEAPGFYEHVAVFDFKSLYPSIIRTFKIDPLSRLKAGTDRLDTPPGIPFSRSEHVLPAYISQLMEKRDQAKRNQDLHLSQAIKILMNSFYGVMGTPGCRFYDHRLPSAITGTGQWVLKHTREHLEQEGYDVIYGDTDSVFVRLKKQELADVEGACRKLAGRINLRLTQKIKIQYGLESRLEIEFERHFIRYFLPAIRGGGEGAKKRYVGMVNINGKEELIFTGLEFVRSDWTRFAKKIQYELFDRIFHDQEVMEWIKKIVADLRNHVYDLDLIYKKRLRKPLREYTKMKPRG
ncbi:MAG: DNA polymerase II [Deltaproteobacteria bacterium]|nr:DNA polymerase II [Deltaproteobacteria bacterium]